uniref:Uncharacterized protein n=1 Tax=Oryza nivara TaxID=4536 RepID=A0A0E0HXZ5_ORYNI
MAAGRSRPTTASSSERGRRWSARLTAKSRVGDIRATPTDGGDGGDFPSSRLQAPRSRLDRGGSGSGGGGDGFRLGRRAPGWSGGGGFGFGATQSRAPGWIETVATAPSLQARRRCAPAVHY